MHHLIFIGLLVLVWPFGRLWQCARAREADDACLPYR